MITINADAIFPYEVRVYSDQGCNWKSTMVGLRNAIAVHCIEPVVVILVDSGTPHHINTYGFILYVQEKALFHVFGDGFQYSAEPETQERVHALSAYLEMWWLQVFAIHNPTLDFSSRDAQYYTDFITHAVLPVISSATMTVPAYNEPHIR